MKSYFVLGTSYSSEENHLEWLYIARWDEEQKKFVGDGVVSRNFVYDLIKTDSASFYTVVYNQPKRTIVKAAKVIPLGEDFLTTESDETEENNLESLPRFEMKSKEIEASVTKMLTEEYRLA